MIVQEIIQRVGFLHLLMLLVGLAQQLVSQLPMHSDCQQPIFHSILVLSPSILWFYPTDISSNNDYGMMGEYMSQTADGVFFISLYNQAPYFGFFGDDTFGSPAISTGVWYHLACVYDSTIGQRYIYLNGLVIVQSSGNSLLVTSGAFTIGGASIGGRTPSLNMYYSGYIDHLTISTRAKSACEVYLGATLACYFPFDSVAPLIDSGPHFLTATNTGATTTTGRVNQAFIFSSATSYILITGVSALLVQNTVFSISMWVNPTSVSGGGTLIHTSSLASGVYLFTIFPDRMFSI
jgi:hypothetical protein